MTTCNSPLATRPILYTDQIRGKMVARDDLWAVTTDELNALLPCAVQDGRCQSGGACQELGQCNPQILRAPAQCQSTETWWMIEFMVGLQPRWFTGDKALGVDYFTADPNKGARFATKAGAEMALKSMWWIPREKTQERPLQSRTVAQAIRLGRPVIGLKQN